LERRVCGDPSVGHAIQSYPTLSLWIPYWRRHAGPKHSGRPAEQQLQRTRDHPYIYLCYDEIHRLSTGSFSQMLGVPLAMIQVCVIGPSCRPRWMVWACGHGRRHGQMSWQILIAAQIAAVIPHHRIAWKHVCCILRAVVEEPGQERTRAIATTPWSRAPKARARSHRHVRVCSDNDNSPGIACRWK